MLIVKSHLLQHQQASLLLTLAHCVALPILSSPSLASCCYSCIASPLIVSPRPCCRRGLSYCVIVDCCVVIVAHSPTVGCCVCCCYRVSHISLRRIISPRVSLLVLRLFFLRCVVILARLVVAVSRVVSSHLVSPHPSHQRSLSHYVIVADLPVLSSLSLALCRLISYPLTHLIDAVSHNTSSLLIVALSSWPITHRPMVGCCVQRLSQFIALRHVPSRVSSRISRVASLCCVALSSPTARPWHSRHLLF